MDDATSITGFTWGESAREQGEQKDGTLTVWIGYHGDRISVSCEITQNGRHYYTRSRMVENLIAGEVVGVHYDFLSNFDIIPLEGGMKTTKNTEISRSKGSIFDFGA